MRFHLHVGLSFVFLLTLQSLPARAADYFPAPDNEGGWRIPKNAGQARKAGGVDVARLDQAFEYAQRTSQHGGLLVVRHGWLVYEKYYGKGNRQANPAMASVGKAYTSIACGIMLQEKREQIPDGLDQKVFTRKYLPEAFPLSDPAKADITLGELLSMSSGMHGEGNNPGFIKGQPLVKLDPMPRPEHPLDIDGNALHAPLWTKPGGGYCYSSQSPHVATIVLRHLTGMEMQQYIDEKLAKPMGWGRWTYALYHDGAKLPHTPGGGDIAVHSTDAARFGYLLLHKGRWGSQQLVPAGYVERCGRPSPYNPHSPFGLMFEVNADRHLAGAPPDTFFKSGAGGFGIAVIPSLDMVIYKMAGDDSQYDPARTGLPQTYKYDGSRDGWKPEPHTQFNDGPIGGDDGLRRTIEMVAAAVTD